MSAWVLQKADMFSVRRDAGPRKNEEAKRGEVRRGEASTTKKGCGIHIQKARFAPLSSFIFPLSPFPFSKPERRWRNATSHSEAGSDEDWENGGRLTCRSMPEHKAPVARDYENNVATTGNNKTCEF